ncbi:hypothetical protein [Komagataeibacter sp. FNDCR2]|uniref:hypothetical protein n=1 Tax=Komagataeibacter sp. FNDCR2 TaxID=2878682 RepID=UPI001E4B7EE9|nr:hypothetical protein [Komagataeibacter sp. FNDCR2]MCE2576209.1 hypothetical protein [Komagataeibacter sp. FNDCR2]
MAISSRFTIAGMGMLALALSAGAGQARETAKACHEKFTAARTAGTLNGQTYKAFKAAQCDTGATTGTTAAPAAPAAPAAGEHAAASPAPVAATPAPHPAPALTGATSTTAVMPDAIAARYAKESAGKARMHTCLDQYNANKATNANGGLRWIQHGGGYYSQCNTKLKG